MEDSIILDDAALGEELPKVEVRPASQPKKATARREAVATEQPEVVSCLRNERVIVRFVKKDTGFITNPKHVMYGGLAETAVRIYTVPQLSNGAFKNVLTNSEKEFLERHMGLEHNALSVYLKEGNYWSSFYVRLTKQDNFLDLSDSSDYIKYKVLLANNDRIAESYEAMTNYPKATYEFVMISEKDELSSSQGVMNAMLEATEYFSKISSDKVSLKYILEVLEGKAVSIDSKLDFLKTMVFTKLQTNPKTFLTVVKDEYLPTKILIKACVEYGIIKKRGDFYYIAETNQPLAEGNEDPTLTVSTRYLNNPSRQSVRLMLDAKLKTLKD